jgi:hypothetical protein
MKNSELRVLGGILSGGDDRFDVGGLVFDAGDGPA